MVTGDLNAALVEWVVQYRISDPVKFLFDAFGNRGAAGNHWGLNVFRQ
jgi:regulator of protease activity HflC (stomatin/prohibitin superfamily)